MYFFRKLCIKSGQLARFADGCAVVQVMPVVTIVTSTNDVGRRLGYGYAMSIVLFVYSIYTCVSEKRVL